MSNPIALSRTLALLENTAEVKSVNPDTKAVTVNTMPVAPTTRSAHASEYTIFRGELVHISRLAELREAD